MVKKKKQPSSTISGRSGTFTAKIEKEEVKKVKKPILFSDVEEVVREPKFVPKPDPGPVAEPHVAVQHEPVVVPTPEITNVNVIEIPRGVFDKAGKPLVGNLGENDKARLQVLKDYLSDGFKVAGFTVNQDKYVFLFVK